MDKPRICEVLGVEVGEIISVNFPVGEFAFSIGSDGQAIGENGQEFGAILTEAINHPDRIIRKPRWTEQEVNLATVLMEFRKDDTVTIGKQVNGPVWWRAKSGEHGIFPSELFPSIRPGQSYTLDEIIGGTK